MQACEISDGWTQFLEYAKSRCSLAAFGNWLAPIKVFNSTPEEVVLLVPNIFVKEYLLTNYKKDLCAFLPVYADGEPAIQFMVDSPKAASNPVLQPLKEPVIEEKRSVKLNKNYRFENFIEGPTNQFVKSAGMGVAARPGQSYNPLFIWGGVGLGKTHILHSIGHYINENHKKLKVQCITTEAFINELVDSLRNKSIEKLKQYYRSEVDVLLVDDIQFLQNRLNFEEEFIHMIEDLINQNKQIVITSDTRPDQLKISARLAGRLEWGLVAHLGVPELETRVAIIQSKAELKGLDIPGPVAFFMAERIHLNVRQLEGAVNKLCAECRLMNMNINLEVVEKALKDMLQITLAASVSVEQILKAVAIVFQVRVSDLKGSCRTQKLAFARQIAMYLAKKIIKQPLTILAASFCKTHSTLIYAAERIENLLKTDEDLRDQVEIIMRNI